MVTAPPPRPIWVGDTFETIGLDIPSPKDKIKIESQARFELYHLPIAPKNESHFIMVGAMFLFEDSRIGARQKETAGERPLDQAIYTGLDTETLDDEAPDHQ